MTDTVTAIIQGGSVGDSIFTSICNLDKLRGQLALMKPGPEKSELREQIKDLFVRPRCF